MKPTRWCVAAAGAVLLFATAGSAKASDATDGLRVRAERPDGYRRSQFAEKAQSAKLSPVVPLREAWESGAFAWTAVRRAKFANDATLRSATPGLDKPADLQRADRDPAGWLPAASAKCGYVAKWIAVKLAWGLAVDPAEMATLRTVSTTCATAAPLATTTTTSSSSTTVAGSTPSTTTATNSVSKLLESIRIGPEYTAGYDRELFPHWKDLDGDGCDARQNVLIRDSKVKATVAAGCRVLAGKWVSPYDGGTWSDPSDVDIDHVVALNEAWQSGAYAWTTQQRTNYANDLTDSRTLMAVTDSVNQAKSDKDPTEWLPPLASYRCTYLSNWVAIKVRWSLRMDQSEYNFVKSELAGCSGVNVSLSTIPTTLAPEVSVSVATTSVVAPTPNTVAGYVYPGAFCSPYGAVGQAASGLIYTCKPSETEARNRWRR